jgi:RNA polymerase sigma-70 factor (ECF subfamily)
MIEVGTSNPTGRARLAQMFERHAGAIRRTLQSRGLSADAADDATQQAFLVASQRLEDIRPGRERAFLFAVVFRLTRSKHRRTRRYQFEANMDVHAARTSTAAPTERVLALQLINRVLDKLDQDLMQAFLLFELEQLSTSEVALQLGIPSGTAASRRRRARETLEATLTRLELSAQSLGSGARRSPSHEAHRPMPRHRERGSPRA